MYIITIPVEDLAAVLLVALHRQRKGLGSLYKHSDSSRNYQVIRLSKAATAENMKLVLKRDKEGTNCKLTASQYTTPFP
jgi:hypothetical protein